MPVRLRSTRAGPAARPKRPRADSSPPVLRGARAVAGLAALTLAAPRVALTGRYRGARVHAAAYVAALCAVLLGCLALWGGAVGGGLLTLCRHRLRSPPPRCAAPAARRRPTSSRGCAWWTRGASGAPAAGAAATPHRTAGAAACEQRDAPTSSASHYAPQRQLLRAPRASRPMPTAARRPSAARNAQELVFRRRGAASSRLQRCDSSPSCAHCVPPAALPTRRPEALTRCSAARSCKRACARTGSRYGAFARAVQKPSSPRKSRLCPLGAAR
jgi:hypothetical protein